VLRARGRVGVAEQVRGVVVAERRTVDRRADEERIAFAEIDFVALRKAAIEARTAAAIMIVATECPAAGHWRREFANL